MARHFMYLTNTRLASLVMEGRQVVARREFEASAEGATEFERYAPAYVRAPTYLFTDLAEEDFRLDTIPHVGPRDRDAVVGRKLTQIFRATPYRQALLQGREPEGRRDDRIVYTAITNPEVLRSWIEVLDKLKIPLEGIYSAAVFSGKLLEALDLVFPHTLLVLFSPGETLRQSYFRDREIKFSRLSPIDLEEGQSLGGMLAEETTRTWQYLDSLRNFGPDDRLEVCVLAHPRDRPAIQPALRDFAQIQYRFLDIEQVALKLGVKSPPAGSTAEDILVHLFMMRPASNHYASSEMRRHATLRRARIVLNQLSLGVLAASIAWGGWNLARILTASEGSQRVNQQVSALNREYDEITRALPSFGVGGAAMRDAVTFYNGSIRGFPAITQFLLPLSGVLEGHPQVRLSQLAWQATDDPKAMPPISTSNPKNLPPVKAIARIAERGAGRAAAEEANPPFAGGRYEVALVEAVVRVATNDFRGALTEVERLAEDIRRMKGFRADVIESPLDVRPSVAIQGRHAERDEGGMMEPRFVLRIVRERSAGESGA